MCGSCGELHDTTDLTPDWGECDTVECCPECGELVTSGLTSEGVYSLFEAAHDHPELANEVPWYLSSDEAELFEFGVEIYAAVEERCKEIELQRSLRSNALLVLPDGGLERAWISGCPWVPEEDLGFVGLPVFTLRGDNAGGVTIVGEGRTLALTRVSADEYIFEYEMIFGYDPEDKD
jgi:hypothetical protein